MIEYHYKNPPKLLPSLRDVLRCNSIEKNSNKIVDTIETDQNDGKTNLICNETLDDPPLNKKQKLTNIDVELENFDLSSIKLLAFQRLQEILMENPNLLNKKSNDLKTINEICKSSPIMNMPLPSQLLSKEDIEKIAREFGSSQSDCEDENQFNSNNLIKKEFYYPQSEQEKAQQFATNIQLKIKDSNIRARAVIVPIDGILNDENKWLTKYSMVGSAFMRYRKLTIGTGPGNDLQLINNSHCTHISNKHAVIFFDDATNNFELLNYSEYGTEVNGQLYSCDFTEHEPTPSRIVNDPKCFYENVRNILDKRRGVVREHYEVDGNAR